MKVLGVNAGQSIPLRKDPEGLRRLSDGAAVLMNEGSVDCAVIEERVSDNRYEGGFSRSARTCLESTHNSVTNLDIIAMSTCCDLQWTREQAHEYFQFIFNNETVPRPEAFVTVDHHESHAMAAFMDLECENDPALICVIDGIGNRLNEQGAFQRDEQWWEGAFQRQTWYLAQWKDRRVSLQKVHEDGAGLDEIGVGEIYRSVTKYLGWDSYQFAGKTMALAAFGSSKTFEKAELISSSSDGRIIVPVPNIHNDPCLQVVNAFRLAGYQIPEAFGKMDISLNPIACDIAALVQKQLEDAICTVTPFMADKYGVKYVGFSGGVAMNCVALGRLHRENPHLRLFVPSAPGDTGQAYGNALWAAYSEKSNFSGRLPRPKPLGVCWFGPQYSTQQVSRTVDQFLMNNPDRYYHQVYRTKRLLVDAMVDLLCEGKVLALRQGRSEYGPRALGHSSILADPRSKEAHEKVNAHKKREPFRPYAPSILEEHVEEWLEATQVSPFMSFAGWWTKEAAEKVPAVVHVDGSARYHSVGMRRDFYRLALEQFYSKTSVPVLLNTSFNQAGKAMAETPAQALEAFQSMRLDALILENHLLLNTTKKG